MYTPKELLGFSIIIYACRNRGNMSENEYLRVWDDGTRNIKLNQAEFLDKGSLSKDSAFNVLAVPPCCSEVTCSGGITCQQLFC